jgi:hypothetical protein
MPKSSEPKVVHILRKTETSTRGLNLVAFSQAKQFLGLKHSVFREVTRKLSPPVLLVVGVGGRVLCTGFVY